MVWYTSRTATAGPWKPSSSPLELARTLSAWRRPSTICIERAARRCALLRWGKPSSPVGQTGAAAGRVM
eukprot:scaffold81013_cov64-Phaeocystis_antarctica.AAC.4